MSDAPKPALHPLNCVCDLCCLRRRVEAEARMTPKDARAEELRGKRAAFFEGKPIVKVKNRRPRRGSIEALRALGRRGY